MRDSGLQEYKYFLYGRPWLCAGLQLNLIISMIGDRERERRI